VENSRIFSEIKNMEEENVPTTQGSPDVGIPAAL
jgi:hypothetical protein